MESPLCSKTLAFAERILDMSDYLLKSSHFKKPAYSLEVAAKQVTRSGTSIGANVKEGVAAQSKADLYSKHHIALKEAHETEYWLILLLRKKHITPKQFDSIHSDLEEILKMLTASTKTLKSQLSK